jgi:hypothetical protein
VIRYALRCDRGHSFDSWFASASAYDSQRKRKLVECPNCGSAKIEKAIMAPRLSRNKAARPAAEAAVGGEVMAPSSPAPLMMTKERELRAKLRELRDHIKKNADDVGEKFPEEARKMHYGEIEHRPIYGEASLQEAREMIEEGLEVAPIPLLPDERN